MSMQEAIGVTMDALAAVSACALPPPRWHVAPPDRAGKLLHIFRLASASAPIGHASAAPTDRAAHDSREPQPALFN